MAANDFSRTPPTGSTLPLRVISPVIASLALGGTLRSKEVRVVAMVTPADGPSFLVAPSGK